MNNILVTGGLGFIGSHTVVDLIENGYNPIILDNLYNSKELVIERLNKITNKKIKYYKGDIRDEKILNKIFSENDIYGVIHFAGLKAVGESVEKPLMYYENNVWGTVNLLKVMEKYKVYNFVFSSSATVYGDRDTMPLREDMEKLPATNPYGRTKSIIEDILKDLYISNNKFNIMVLRYFNPIGAHSSTLIGEDPEGIPNNLLPFISQVAVGRREKLSVFGSDYDTIDGTGVRDYVHVMDLAVGHTLALNNIENKKGYNIYNLGTGRGESVLEVINAFKKASGVDIPYKIEPRRSGDVAICYADTKKAEEELGFKAKYNILDMCKSSYEFQKKNPRGYES